MSKSSSCSAVLSRRFDAHSRKENYFIHSLTESGEWNILTLDKCEKEREIIYFSNLFRSWQQMYSWMSWRSIEAFTIEGGEATLWTDFVDSSKLTILLKNYVTNINLRNY